MVKVGTTHMKEKVKVEDGGNEVSDALEYLISGRLY